MKEELAEIDARAFEMARSVANNPALRATLGPEAARLSRRLSELIKEIDTLDDMEYMKLSYLMLEVMQDLRFVEKDSRMVSARLTREIGPLKDI